MNMLKPRSRSDVMTREIRNQKVLFDHVSQTSHVLNETAEFVWNLCDGEHTVTEMAEEVRLAFDVPEDVDLADDIQRAINLLLKKGLLLAEPQAQEND
jgi:aminopeptidase-like protein